MLGRIVGIEEIVGVVVGIVVGAMVGLAVGVLVVAPAVIQPLYPPSDLLLVYVVGLEVGFL